MKVRHLRTPTVSVPTRFGARLAGRGSVLRMPGLRINLDGSSDAPVALQALAAIPVSSWRDPCDCLCEEVPLPDSDCVVDTIPGSVLVGLIAELKKLARSDDAQDTLDEFLEDMQEALANGENLLDKLKDAADGAGKVAKVAQRLRQAGKAGALSVIEGLTQLGINLISSNRILDVYRLVLQGDCTRAESKVRNRDFQDKVEGDISGLKKGGGLTAGLQKLAASAIYELFAKLIGRACARQRRKCPDKV